MIFMRVDLPAPFSPLRACTVPRPTRRDTSSRATTPGNALQTFLTSRRQPSEAPSRISMPAEVTGQIARRHQLEGYPHEARKTLAPDELQRSVDGSSALSGGVLEYRRLELSRLHRSEPVG